MARKLVILGHSGFIGQHLNNAFLKDPSYEVYGFSSTLIDLSSSKSAMGLNDFIGDAYLIMAASALIKNKNAISFWRDVSMFINIANLKMFSGIKHLIYISSTAIYGRQRYFPVTECDPPDPGDFYSSSKLIGELVFKQVCADKGVRLTILRPGIIYGQGDVRSPVYRFINDVRMGEKIKMRGDQSTRLAFTHKDDLKGVISCVINQRKLGDYNIVSDGSGISLINLAEAVFNLCGARTDIEFISDNKVSMNIRFDTSKFKANFPGFKFISFEDGIKDYLIP